MPCLHGSARPQVLLAKEGDDDPTVRVYLTVNTFPPLRDPVQLYNSTCGMHNGDAECTHPLNSAQLNISAYPPLSCDEHCPWVWLWWRCRCHASANLTVILPNASNGVLPIMRDPAPVANVAGSDGTPLAVAEPPMTASRARDLGLSLLINVVSVHVDSHGTDVVVGPAQSGLSQLLNVVNVSSIGGDILIRDVLALGGLDAQTDTGVVTMRGILGGGVHAHGAKLIIEDAVAAQPCVFLGLWVGGDACESLPLPPGFPAVAPIAIVMLDMNLTATGGLILMNGMMGATDTHVNSTYGGLAIFDGAWFLGSLAIDMGQGGGEASLVNVLSLDCRVCKDFASIADLPWAALPLSPKANLFCACEMKDEGIAFDSTDAKLSAVLTIAHRIKANTSSGDLSFDEIVLLPPSASVNGTVAQPTAPGLWANSTYGNVALNGMIATKGVAGNLIVDLASMAGDVKAVFSGGAFSGHYDVITAPDGIGHVGIVVDSTPTSERSGSINDGMSNVTISHDYGNVALALSTKAPSVFAGISSGLDPKTAASLVDPIADTHCAADGGAIADAAAVRPPGVVIADDALLPPSLEWMRPLAGVLSTMSTSAARVQATMSPAAEERDDATAADSTAALRQ